MLERALEIDKRFLPEYPDTLELANSLANAYLYLKRRAKAESLLLDVIRVTRGRGAVRPLDAATYPRTKSHRTTLRDTIAANKIFSLVTHCDAECAISIEKWAVFKFGEGLDNGWGRVAEKEQHQKATAKLIKLNRFTERLLLPRTKVQGRRHRPFQFPPAHVAAMVFKSSVLDEHRREGSLAIPAYARLMPSTLRREPSFCRRRFHNRRRYNI